MPRHEQALAHAADGYARSTGKVGVCMVTSDLVQPILTNWYCLLLMQIVCPSFVLLAKLDLGLMGNDAFQEVDTVGY